MASPMTAREAWEIVLGKYERERGAALASWEVARACAIVEAKIDERAADSAAIVAALEKERDALEREQCKFRNAPPSTVAHAAGYVQGLSKAIDIVKELSK